MYSKQVPVGTQLVAGIASALVVGLILSIGISRAARGGPVGTAKPTHVLEAPSAVDTGLLIGTVVEIVVARPEPTPRVNPTVSPVRAHEPARRLREETSVDLDRLVLVGDSLAEEAAPVIGYLTPGKVLVTKFWGGTAPCDWIDKDLEATATAVVVITFTGNNLTPCMLDPTGARLVDEPLVEQYRTGVGVLIGHARAVGAWVVLVGQPLRHPSFDADSEVEGINAVYRKFAETMPNVSYIDAGHLVETPDGRYTDRLPCAEFDTDCGADGTMVVRGDGVHFCPVSGVSPCPVWSSGAVRFGLGIATAANNPARFD